MLPRAPRRSGAVSCKRARMPVKGGRRPSERQYRTPGREIGSSPLRGEISYDRAGHSSDMEHAVIFLPGIIAPAAVRYSALVEQLPGVRSLMHDLAVYDGDEPPADYSISAELDALDRA